MAVNTAAQALATIGEAFAQLGIEERPGEDIVLVQFMKGGDEDQPAKPKNCPYAANKEKGIPPDTYIATGRFRPGTWNATSGRAGDNVVSIPALVLDCDVKDLYDCEAKELWPLPQPDLDEMIDDLRENVVAVHTGAALTPNRLVCSGYGLQLWFDIAPEDQGRIEELRVAYKALVRAMNALAGYQMADRQVSDAGSRIARLPGSVNTKGEIPRQVRIIHEDGRCWTVNDLQWAIARAMPPEAQSPPQAKATPKPPITRSGDLSPAHETEIIALIGPYWTIGNRHELALGSAGWLLKTGASESQATRIIDALAGDDPERADRLKAVETTYRRAGGAVAGWTKLLELLPLSVTDRLSAIGTDHWRSQQPKGWAENIDIGDAFDSAGETTATGAAGGDSDAGAGCEMPVFPLDALPPKVRAYVRASADSLSVPAEMVAVPLLGLAGALVGNRLHLVLKPSWRAYPTLYLAVVAPPGSAKSPALDLARWPLDALQKDAHDRYSEQLAEYDAEHARWKAKGKKQGEPEPAKPRLRHYFSTDLTVEALAGMLGHNPGVAVIRDEISGWVAAMDQYRSGKGSDRQQYLSLWSGQTLKVDRKGDGSLYVPEPVTCVLGGIQPDLAGTLHDATKGRDGFVERILPVVPNVGPAIWTDEAPSTEQYCNVLDVFRALDAFAYPTTVSETGLSRGYGVNLSREARADYIAWHGENAQLVADAEGLAKGFYSKLPAHVARLALILHALWNPDDPSIMVSGERMHDAIELGEFFRAHIGRFLALLRSSAPKGAAGLKSRILRIMRTPNEEGGWVARSIIYRGLRNVPAEILSDALDGLTAAGAIERRTIPTASRPIEQYRFARFAYSHYSHYSDSPSTEMAAIHPNGGDNANNANDNSYFEEATSAAAHAALAYLERERAMGVVNAA